MNRTKLIKSLHKSRQIVNHKKPGNLDVQVRLQDDKDTARQEARDEYYHRLNARQDYGSNCVDIRQAWGFNF